MSDLISSILGLSSGYIPQARPSELRQVAARDQSASGSNKSDRAEISQEARARYAQAGAHSEDLQPVVAQTERNARDHSESDSSKQEGSSKAPDKRLTPKEQEQLSKLKARDTEVRAHEAAHLAAAGALAAGGAQFEYQKGPDGHEYAIGGEVQISSGGGRTPQERLANDQQVQRAALAPANPSSTDRSVASGAAADSAQAQQELIKQQVTKSSSDETPVSDGEQTDSDSTTSDSSPERSSNDPIDSVSSPWKKAAAAYAQSADIASSNAAKSYSLGEKNSSSAGFVDAYA
jgi:hypothetical protein